MRSIWSGSEIHPDIGTGNHYEAEVVGRTRPEKITSDSCHAILRSRTMQKQARAGLREIANNNRTSPKSNQKERTMSFLK